MGVTLWMEDENGAQLAAVPDPRGYVMCIVSLADQGNSSCLRFIDPYGDTVFNQVQMPVLIVELEAARHLVTEQRIRELAKQALGPNWEREAAMRKLSAADVKNHLDQVLALARRCQAEPHLYLKFYGD